MYKFGNTNLAFLCGEANGSLCLHGVSSQVLYQTLSDDSDEVKCQKIADKPFKNPLVVGLILSGPSSLICNSGVVSLGASSNETLTQLPDYFDILISNAWFCFSDIMLNPVQIQGKTAIQYRLHISRKEMSWIWLG